MGIDLFIFLYDADPDQCYHKTGWLLFNANSAIFQLCHVNFQRDDDEVRFVLDQHANSLKQHSADRHVAQLGNIILIPSQSVFALSP